MADIIIVPMEECHVMQVAGLEAQCFSMPWSEKAFADAVESPNYEYIAALDGADDSVIGYAGMQVVLDEAEITNIAVNPLYRLHVYQSQNLSIFILQYYFNMVKCCYSTSHTYITLPDS